MSSSSRIEIDEKNRTAQATLFCAPNTYALLQELRMELLAKGCKEVAYYGPRESFHPDYKVEVRASLYQGALDSFYYNNPHVPSTVLFYWDLASDIWRGKLWSVWRLPHEPAMGLALARFVLAPQPGV